MGWESISIDDEVKRELEKHKGENESWTEMLERMAADAIDAEKFPVRSGAGGSE